MSTADRPMAEPVWAGIQGRALMAGVVGLVLLLLGAVISPAHFFRSYLVAYIFWLSLALGCLVLLMLQHLTGGAWGILLRRVLESGARTLICLAVLFVPLLPGLHLLYIWARPEAVALDPELAHKQPYLNVPFFMVRAAIYFAIWLTIGYFLTKWSAEQDGGVLPDRARRFRMLSGPGLALYGATITFASIDWVMSLEPRWYSTMYPVLFAVAQVLTGMAFAVAVVLLLATRPPLDAVLSPARRRDLGNLLLTFVMFWAYLSFSQFLLIWVESLPEETPWYLLRTRGGWGWVALALVVFQFTVPFLLLLSRDIKENTGRLVAVAVLILVMRFVDVFWWIEAAFPGGMGWYWLLDVVALVGMGGLWLWWFCRQLTKLPLLPVHDPYLPEYLPEAVPHE